MNIRQAIYDWLGRILVLEPAQQVTDCRLSLAAPWARSAPLWLLLALLGLAAVAAVFYFRFQPTRHRGWRTALFAMRAAVLCLLLLLLAEPILTATVESQRRPSLWFLFDGSDSMNIADSLPAEAKEAADRAVGIEADSAAVRSPGDRAAAPDASPRSRADYLRSLAKRRQRNLFTEFDKDFRLQAYLFESSQSVQSLDMRKGDGLYDGDRLAEQLTADGKVTDLGGALTDLAHRNPAGSVAGLVVFSDFRATPGGPDPVKAAQQFGTKIYTVGVGATQVTDLAATVSAEPYARTNDEVSVNVVMVHRGLAGQTARVRLFAEPLGTLAGGAGQGRKLVGEKSVVLSSGTENVPFVYKPDTPGRFDLVAVVDRLAGEVNDENNRAHGEIIVLDDYLRLMFVEYEPTWEWRFIKEVFHRDPLVGMKGFRTFLYSSDPQVRRQNELFLTSMAPPREEFFKNDLIFIGDMPSGPPNPALNDRFCKMVKEFVGDMGGGLVVLCGPRFGPQQLVRTELADLLPVTIDTATRVRDQESYMLQVTPRAAEYPFMLLGANPSKQELQKAWDSLGPLPWYQPVQSIRETAHVLAEHPTATCEGGRKQPLIAIRQYGRGEVVYLGFNETWRLRREHGEELFRRFWKEVMWRLALNHALGAEKRFIVRTDRQRYAVDQTVTVNVSAFNAKYEALSESDVSDRKLVGEWVSTAAGSQEPVSRPLSLTQVRPGLFETHFTVTAPGEHRVRVTDPVTRNPVEWHFTAYSAPVERQEPDRNAALQDAIASVSGGRSLELKDVDSLLQQIQPTLRTEARIEVVSLVNTWTCFLLIAGLLLLEWLLRKGIGLS